VPGRFPLRYVKPNHRFLQGNEKVAFVLEQLHKCKRDSEVQIKNFRGGKKKKKKVEGRTDLRVARRGLRPGRPGKSIPKHPKKKKIGEKAQVGYEYSG